MITTGVCVGCAHRHILAEGSDFCKWCVDEIVCEIELSLCEFCDCERLHHLNGRCLKCNCIGFLENATEREFSYWSRMALELSKKDGWEQ